MLESVFCSHRILDLTLFNSFIKSSNFLEITTGFKMSTIPSNKILKAHGVRIVKQILPIAYEQVTSEFADVLYGDEEQAIKRTFYLILDFYIQATKV